MYYWCDISFRFTGCFVIKRRKKVVAGSLLNAGSLGDIDGDLSDCPDFCWHWSGRVDDEAQSCTAAEREAEELGERTVTEWTLRVDDRVSDTLEEIHRSVEC